MDILEAAKVDPPKTWDEFIEVCKKLQKPPKLTGFGMCLGLHTDADNNIINMIWSHGGKLVEDDDKTVALNSPGTVQAVKMIADMYLKHKIIPKGAVSWDNQGNNKAYQSRQVIFVLNASSIYAYLSESDKELYDVTGMLPVPAGPAGPCRSSGHRGVDALQAQSLPRDRQRVCPVLPWSRRSCATVMEEGGGRWGPPYKGMYEDDFWKRPTFQHWRGMLGRGTPVRLPRQHDVQRQVRCWPPMCCPA